MRCLRVVMTTADVNNHRLAGIGLGALWLRLLLRPLKPEATLERALKGAGNEHDPISLHQPPPQQPLSASISLRQPPSASVSLRQPLSASISLRQPLSASISLRQPLSASVSLHQPLSASTTSASVSLRQPPSASGSPNTRLGCVGA